VKFNTDDKVRIKAGHFKGWSGAARAFTVCCKDILPDYWVCKAEYGTTYKFHEHQLELAQADDNDIIGLSPPKRPLGYEVSL